MVRVGSGRCNLILVVLVMTRSLSVQEVMHVGSHGSEEFPPNLYSGDLLSPTPGSCGFAMAKLNHNIDK